MKRFSYPSAMVTLFACASLFANPLAPPDNHKKYAKSHERGYLFKGLDENSTVALAGKAKSAKVLLGELVKIAKEQLKVQKEILKEVRLIRKPGPEKIVVNGKECVANSSAECFQMPLTPTAQKIPVYRDWLRDPSEKNSLALVRWESKYFNAISNSAHSRDFVITKYGDQALKTSFNRSTFDSIGGAYRVTRSKNDTFLLNSIAKNTFEAYLFFGKSPELDYQSFHNYAKTMKDLGDVVYHVVFYTSGAKEAFEDSARTFKEIDTLLKKAKDVKVDKSLFKRANIYTTPTFAILIKKTNTIEPVSVGNYFSKGINRRIIKMLTMKGIVKPEHSPDYKMFDRVGTIGEDFVSRYYGKDLNMTRIKELYRKDGKQHD